VLFPLLALLLADSVAIQVGQISVVAPPELQTLAVTLAEQAERPVEWPGLGRRAPPPFTLILAPDSTTLARLTRGRAPGWGAGVAIPSARRIYLRADLPDLARTLRHEVAHLVLRDAIRTRTPLWFDEGYAAWASGELERFATLELNLAVAAGRLPTLPQLDAMLRSSAATADLAYALAASAVLEVSRRPPAGALERVVAGLVPGATFYAALEQATGLNESAFERAWHQGLRRRYSLLTWLAAGGLWLLVAVGVVAVAWHRKRRDAPRRAALDWGWPRPEESEACGGGGTSSPGGPVDPGAPRQ
jgi:hypothetical protein